MSVQEKALDELKAIPDSEIDYSDIPETDVSFWKDAKVKKPKSGKAISLHVDKDVLAWFKSQDKEYQSLMSAVLKAYVQSKRSKHFSE